MTHFTLLLIAMFVGAIGAVSGALLRNGWPIGICFVSMAFAAWEMHRMFRVVLRANDRLLDENFHLFIEANPDFGKLTAD